MYDSLHWFSITIEDRRLIFKMLGIEVVCLAGHPVKFQILKIDTETIYHLLIISNKKIKQNSLNTFGLSTMRIKLQ